jgi:hypothetical protein
MFIERKGEYVQLSDIKAGDLKEWLSHELKMVAMNEVQQAEPARNISLRVSMLTHFKLQRIAQKLADSKSACAQKIITHAVEEIYKELGLPEASIDDVRQYAKETSDGPEGSKTVGTRLSRAKLAA